MACCADVKGNPFPRRGPDRIKILHHVTAIADISAPVCDVRSTFKQTIATVLVYGSANFWPLRFIKPPSERRSSRKDCLRWSASAHVIGAGACFFAVSALLDKPRVEITGRT